MTTHRYDAVIVGARVAGAATGMLLARAGLDVLVVDGARYGSDMLSTHALMRGGVLQLSRWGLLDDIILAGTPVVRRSVMRYGDTDEVVTIKPQPGFEGLYAPRRTVLDRVLADAASRSGADVRFRTRATELARRADGRVEGLTTIGPGGRQEQVRAPVVIGADGVKSWLARAVNAPTTARGRNATAFSISWYSGVEADGYQWLYGHGPDGLGRAAGIVPTNDGQVCAWVGVPQALFATRRPEAHLEDVLGWIAPDWAARLAAGHRDGPVRGFPGVSGYLRRPWGAGWALAGDAGYFKDPITAHGLTDALRDAELLARAVVDGTGAGSTAGLEHALAGYEQTRDRLSLPLFRLTDQVASFRWQTGSLRELLIDVSAAMRAEVAHLDALDTPALPDQPVAALAAASA